MPFPSFLLIGANKAGTTSIYHYLGQHPEIYVSPIKEPSFFAIEGRSDLDDIQRAWKMTGSLDEYLALFDGVTTEKAWGEASTAYLSTPTAAANIHRRIPNVKLIAILRHPIERAYSQYAMNARLGIETLPTFEAAVQAELNHGPQLPCLPYLAMGYYFTQLQRYTSCFDARQILVLVNRDLSAAPLGVMRRIFRFLEVDDAFAPDLGQRHNVAPDRPLPAGPISPRLPGPLRRIARALLSQSLQARIRDGLRAMRPSRPAVAPTLRRQLVALYRPEISNLQDLIGRDLSDWLR